MEKPLVMVTGASHGIGRAVATKFASAGHPLLLIARHTETLDGLPDERVRQAAIDVADYAALEGAIRAAEAVSGRCRSGMSARCPTRSTSYSKACSTQSARFWAA
jgi:NADP-dependent 3-hydroxy acid dehydrogenase YdfG